MIKSDEGPKLDGDKMSMSRIWFMHWYKHAFQIVGQYLFVFDVVDLFSGGVICFICENV